MNNQKEIMRLKEEIKIKQEKRNKENLSLTEEKRRKLDNILRPRSPMNHKLS